MAKKTYEGKKEFTPVKKDSPLRYIMDNLLNRATDGAIDKQTSNFQVTFNKILSELHKKAVFQILEYPTWVKPGHLESLRDRLLQLVPPNMINDVDIHIVEYDVPNQMSVSNKKMSRMANRVTQAHDLQEARIKKTEELLDANKAPAGVTHSSLDLAKIKLARQKRLKDSFRMVREHKNSGGTYLKSYIFLELTTRTVEQLEVATKILKDLLATGVKRGKREPEPYVYEQITNELYEYIKRFGVASLVPPLKKKDDKMPCMSVTSNISVLDEAYKPGIIRATRPKVYAGHLLGNNYMYHTNFTDSTDASNLLMLAKTGSGKTVQIMTMMLWCLADKKQHVIINDYKGGEWREFANLVKNKAVIDFNMAHPSFVNTYKIPDHRLLGMTPRETYELCAGITEQILTALVNPDPSDFSLVEALCSDIVFKVFSTAGVDPVLENSYYKSENIKFSSATWSAICELTDGTTDESKRYEPRIRNRVRTVLARYFDARGDKYSMFKEEAEIDLDQVLKSKLIIIDYGMQTASGAVIRGETEYRCWMLQKFFITKIYCSIQKMKHEYSIEVQEEVAQQFTDKLVCQHLCTDITGNRSFNKTNILITNTLDPIIHPVENKATIAPVKENLNMFMLGRCSIEVAKDFIEYIGRPELMTDARNVSQQVSNRYKHAFLLYQESGEMKGSAIMRAVLPPSILNTLMKSRDVDTSGALSQSN